MNSPVFRRRAWRLKAPAEEETAADAKSRLVRPDTRSRATPEAGRPARRGALLVAAPAAVSALLAFGLFFAVLSLG